MTRLQRCSHPECQELIPLDATACAKHTRRSKGEPHKCIEEKCSAIVYGQTLRCNSCKGVVKREQNRINNQNARDRLRFGLTPHRPPPLPPRKKELTPEQEAKLEREQAKINRQCDKRIMDKIAASLGLQQNANRPMSSPVIVYSRAEIDAIFHTIPQPPTAGTRQKINQWPRQHKREFNPPVEPRNYNPFDRVSREGR